MDAWHLKLTIRLARKAEMPGYIFYDYHKLFTQNFNNLVRAAAKCLQVFYTPKDLCRVTTSCRIVWCFVSYTLDVYVACLFCFCRLFASVWCC